MDHLSELPRWCWLYIDAEVSQIALDTVCHPKATDSHDMSEDEISEFEAHAERIGLRCFFYRDQLEDIVENLRQQRANFTPEQLEAAIDFYWRNDAFIDLSREGRAGPQV